MRPPPPDTAGRTGDGTGIVDILGIGIGPFNLSLAALADGVPGLTSLFVEARPEFRWHEGLLLDDARLQVPFLADLVTLVDPTSRWSFLSFLREHDRLFPFYVAERFHIPRREYDEYCRWVARSLPSCRFGVRALNVRRADDHDAFVIDLATPDGARAVHARNVVLGIGTEPAVPACFAPFLADTAATPHCLHAADYLHHRTQLRSTGRVTVIGSGQSGAEVFLDLLRGPHATRQSLAWVTRSRAFAPMEYSKLGLEHFTPDYTRYFHALPGAVRDRLVPTQWQLYKAASADTLAAIHDALYDRLIDATPPGGPDGAHSPLLLPGTEVTGAVRDVHGLTLTCHHLDQGTRFDHTTDAVVLATGYRQRPADVLDGVAPHLATDAQGRLVIDTDYRVPPARPDNPGAAHRGGAIYLQNAELHTHGVGAPDLGLGAHRAAVILAAITGKQPRPFPARTAFTTFGAPAAAPTTTVIPARRAAPAPASPAEEPHA